MCFARCDVVATAPAHAVIAQLIGEWTEEARNALNSVDLSTATYADVASQFPPSNLPGHIAFPSSVAQMVEVVNKAHDMNVGISVKTSGHR